MATIKAVSSKAGINQALDYVTKEKKTEKHLVSGINCQPETVKDEMQLTKELWGKTEGRTYKHFTQSWHEDEPITPELAHQIGCETAAKEPAWAGFEVLVATHVDRGHIHNHFIVNSVSFEDGHKLQWSTADLYELRGINDQLCAEHNLHVCEKGKTFRGEERTAPSTYTKEAYQEIQEDKNSYILAIGEAVAEARTTATDRSELYQLLLEKGILMSWEDSRKYITFTDIDRELEGATKCKVRDKKLSQTVNQEVSKEAFERDFARNRELQIKAAAEAAKVKAVPEPEPEPEPYSFTAIQEALAHVTVQALALHDTRQPLDPAVQNAPADLNHAASELRPAFKKYSSAKFAAAKYKWPWQSKERDAAAAEVKKAYEPVQAIFDKLMNYGVSPYRDGVELKVSFLTDEDIDYLEWLAAMKVTELQQKADHEARFARPANAIEGSPERYNTAQKEFQRLLGTIPPEERKNAREELLDILKQSLNYGNGLDFKIAKSEVKAIIESELKPNVFETISNELDKDMRLAFGKTADNMKNQAAYKKIMSGRER